MMRRFGVPGAWAAHGMPTVDSQLATLVYNTALACELTFAASLDRLAFGVHSNTGRVYLAGFRAAVLPRAAAGRSQRWN